MGDFCVPKRKEVYDKIRRRIEGYRQRHSEAAVRYFDARLSACEQQKQETLLLRQRWLDSKAKKVAKQSKSSRDSANSQSDHRNLVVTKLKRKIDSVSAESNAPTTATTTTTTTASEAVFNFEDNDLQSSSVKNSKINSGNNIGLCGGNKHNTGLPSLSVQIVQQISANCQQDTPQTIHTNVTVSSCFGTDSPNAGGASHSVHTSVQCKQEPSEDSARSAATNSSSSSATHNNNIDSGDISIGIDVDELQNFLASFENGKGQDPSLIKELNEFKEIFDKVQRESENNESGNMYSSLDCPSPGLLKGVFPNLDPCGHIGVMFDSSQNMNSAALTNQSIPVPAVITEPTGPAAETLKQMAAQHQHQHSPGYQGIDHFTDGLHNGGFPPNYSKLYRSVPNMTSTFPFNHSTNHHLTDSSQMTPEMAAAVTYGGTKPLTHFPNEQGQQHNSPSSLQQLQNQVQSHFKPSLVPQHQMHITQTQHMQLSHGSHSMQLTQTQQLQMQPSPQQISLSQQQSFSMGQPQTVSENMKLMEKLRIEQQQQAQQNHLPPQYMGRPPPEYKMHHNARSQCPYPSSMNSSGNQNPLQTMQNMVNQTSAYGTVKSEVGTASSPGQTNNGMMSSQISAMQQQTMSVTMASSGSQIGNLPLSSQGIRPGFHSQQHMQQPPAYTVVESSTRAQSSSTYTSAIMRNQRPPNVNVGPEGLNISQPRTNTDWSRANLMQSGHAGMRPGMSNGCPSTHGIAQPAASSGHMLQYQQRPPHYGVSPSPGGMTSATTNLAQLQQQQVRQSIPGQMRGTPGSGMIPNGTQVMMQHQNMQMSQQMSLHTTNSAYNIGGPTPGTTCVSPVGYNMGGPSPGTTCVSPVGYSMGGPSPGATLNNSQTNGSHPASFLNQPASNQDEFLHFLDNPLSSDSMFDSIQNTGDEFNLFEDIFSGK